MTPLHFSIHIERGWRQPTQIVLKVYRKFCKQRWSQPTQACQKVRRSSIQKKAFMIELILMCMGMCDVHRPMNDQDSTWMSQVSGFRKELLPSLPKAQPTQFLGESPAPCLLVFQSELAPLRPEDCELIFLGPWGIDLIPCLLSLRGRLWITPRELQLHSLHWTGCLLRGV